MSFYSQRNVYAGMTLVEVVIASALVLLVFGAIMTAFQTILTLVGSSKAQAGAVSLANGRMEYIRSLPYNSIGTLAGIPQGVLPELATTSLNGVTYNERILVEYIDDPKDGSGATDSIALSPVYNQLE